jgi:mono/diheme cytochrome c family protein
LYPAMPYPSYARVSEQDMKDLYAYFMQGVEPVGIHPTANGIPWPLSMRWPLGIWRTLFAPDAAKVQSPNDAAAPQADPQLRGAYLVEGLGHCGACHTPRSFTLAEKALNNSDPLFLSGNTQPMEGWMAKSLRGGNSDGLGRWSTQDIVDLLRTGRNNHSAVFGGMREVIQHSTQYVSTNDLQAIAVYLKSLQPSPAHAASPAFAPDTATANALWKGDTSTQGAALYLDNCAACHRSDGKGYAQVFPSLAGNSAVLTSDPHNLIAIILRGQQVPATSTRPSTFTMPAFGWRLSDQQVADVASFVRRSWGNQSGDVTATQVKNLRLVEDPNHPSPAGRSSIASTSPSQ